MIWPTLIFIALLWPQPLVQCAHRLKDFSNDVSDEEFLVKVPKKNLVSKTKTLQNNPTNSPSYEGQNNYYKENDNEGSKGIFIISRNSYLEKLEEEGKDYYAMAGLDEPNDNFISMSNLTEEVEFSPNEQCDTPPIGNGLEDEYRG